jgi:hypothetical protein
MESPKTSVSFLTIIKTTEISPDKTPEPVLTHKESLADDTDFERGSSIALSNRR